MAQHVQRNQGLVKVKFELEPDAWHRSTTETMWATEVTDGRFRLENSPFYAFGVSYRDIVTAKQNGSTLAFQKAVIRGGHSTYRIIRTSDDDVAFASFWGPIQELGCTYEEGDQVLAVDVPPKTDIYKVYELLAAGEKAEVWGFEEGHCGHALKEEE
ncbi:MAG: DUF4265 domain-containing protein [Myxococcota bacterium]